MRSISVRELPNHGGEVLDRVVRGEALIVTRHGADIAELRLLARKSLFTEELIGRRRELPTADPDIRRQDADSILDARL